MSSLHSPRIQCCCCAVGVFAAMFGIFMLSAGICIVLNVTFMEVDTSGLPPDLHNEHGKKVVGIILICVAIAFLGLSATVSIMYFTLCSRKSPDVTKQHKTTPVGTTTGPERIRSRESVLHGKKRATSSSLNVVPVHRPGMHLHSEFSKQKKSYHVLRNRPVLPPHQEEEVDLSKSSTELNRADETFSASTTSNGKKRKQRDRREESVESLDVHIISYSNIRTPVIVVDSFHEKELLAEDEMETQLNDSVIRFDEDSVSNTFSEQCREVESGVPVFNINVPTAGVTSSSSADSQDIIIRHNNLSKLDLKSHPDYLDTASIQTDFTSSSIALVSSSCTSLPELQQQVLVVRPATGASLGSLTNIHSPIDSFSEEDRDSLSCLHVISDQHSTHTILLDESQDGLNRMHHNSAFSFDGNDPPQQCEVDG
ncbi:unnamed protein product [Candidula unifasciata]|uniref:Uncharacterized protein n=1 Tax=Candidula unifasciata TaxID=100452 RepID=A0A8S3Z340_9EUPU|nr:unnamed protein product [Candidula unifasciata]